jgi:hypothetical protein
MSEFPKTRRPQGMLVIPVTSFADDWEHRPAAPVAVGLRLLSEHDGQVVLATADKSTVEFFGLEDPATRRPHPDVEAEIRLSRIMGIAIARAVCDPNDVMKAHEALPGLEDRVFAYFSADGVRFVFEAIQEFTAKTSPLSPEASDEDLRLLRAHLTAGTLAKMSRGEQLAARRLMGCALEMLAARDPLVTADGESDATDNDEEGSGESVYDMRLRA